jgi:hypothetical protein
LVEERPFMAAKGIAFLPRFSAGDPPSQNDFSANADGLNADGPVPECRFQLRAISSPQRTNIVVFQRRGA